MKQEENIRELAIQYFEGRISRADEKTLFECIEQTEGGYGRFRQWEKEWMSNRVSDSQTDAEWEALKHRKVSCKDSRRSGNCLHTGCC